MTLILGILGRREDEITIGLIIEARKNRPLRTSQSTGSSANSASASAPAKLVGFVPCLKIALEPGYELIRSV
jgi:hypothetical protein